MKRIPTMARATGPKNQVRKGPTRPRAVVGSPLPTPVVQHPGVVVTDYSDLVPEGFEGADIVVGTGPTIKTNTKGVPLSAFHVEP